MGRWKICLTGVLAFTLVIGILCLSQRQVDEISRPDSELPNADYMDMSSILEEYPSYIGTEEEGIYAGRKIPEKKELDMEKCRVVEDAGMEYMEKLRTAVASGNLEQMVDWQKVPVEQKEEAEAALKLFTSATHDRRGIYVTEQFRVDDGLVVRFMIMNSCHNTVYGRIYDYEHADRIVFTFFEGSDGRITFVPFSLLS